MRELTNRAATDRRRELLVAGVDAARTPAGLRPGSPRVESSFFGLAWFVVAAVVVLIGAGAGRSGLAVIGLLALVSAGLAWAWARVALNAVTVTARFDRQHALPGDTVELVITAVNRKLIPVPWATLEVELPRGLRVGESSRRRLSGEQILRLSSALAPFGRLTWRSSLGCPVRGVHEIGPVTVRAGDPFGFFSVRMEGAAPEPIVVYPVVVPVLPLANARERLGDVRVDRHLYTDPTRVAGVRDYQPGDPFRAISWKATARNGSLQTRLEEPATSRQVMVCVNLDTHERVWEGVDSASAESTIAAAASILARADGAGYAVGVMANGLEPGTASPLVYAPARGAGQLARCLDGLARLSLMSTAPFSQALVRLERTGDRGGVIAIVTSRVPEATRTAIAQLLGRGRRVVLVPLGDAAELSLPSIPVYRVDEAAIRERLSLVSNNAVTAPPTAPDRPPSPDRPPLDTDHRRRSGHRP